MSQISQEVVDKLHDFIDSLPEVADTEDIYRTRRNEKIKRLLTATGNDAGVNGTIYFARDTKRPSLFKIGSTINGVNGRLSQLSGYKEKNTWELIDAVELPGLSATRKTEHDIHKQFADWRQDGEMFRADCMDCAIAYTKSLASDMYSHIKSVYSGSFKDNRLKVLR